MKYRSLIALALVAVLATGFATAAYTCGCSEEAPSLGLLVKPIPSKFPKAGITVVAVNPKGPSARQLPVNTSLYVAKIYSATGELVADAPLGCGKCLEALFKKLCPGQVMVLEGIKPGCTKQEPVAKYSVAAPVVVVTPVVYVVR